ncbi:uncharacterized protein PAC_04949 [Phialocephala subalpina]|uniref:Protein kinase domain-containing protein n=1 Tax=Phialocephala subalpina TaxID=576137 RepID=A0A1L7WQL4_9HELO|nr:uncharacterized protein PAC_04949 [Phialocephala subalpina]
MAKPFDDLDSYHSDPSGIAKWTGTKFLGWGGNAIVGLWRYGTKKRYVAVKEIVATGKYAIKDPTEANLRKEGEVVDTTKICYSKGRGAQLTVEKYSEEALLGNCPLGSLHDLMMRRAQDFDCLIDGVTAMSYGGAEMVLDPMVNQATITRPQDWDEIVHFDLKPRNIFLGDKDPKHKKVLSRRWDFAGWATDPLAGHYDFLPPEPTDPQQEVVAPTTEPGPAPPVAVAKPTTMVDARCQARHQTGPNAGERCINFTTAVQAVINANNGRCEEHPLDRFPWTPRGKIEYLDAWSRRCGIT